MSQVLGDAGATVNAPATFDGRPPTRTARAIGELFLIVGDRPAVAVNELGRSWKTPGQPVAADPKYSERFSGEKTAGVLGVGL